MLRLPPAGWSPPHTVVFVVGAPRCGSNLLCAAMGETGVLGQPHEFFHKSFMARRRNLPNLTFDDCCAIAVAEGTTANGVMASKLFWHQFNEMRQQLDFDRWFTAPRWVFLRRRDELGQAVSWAMAMSTHQWMADWPAKHPLVYSRRTIQYCIHRIRQDTEGWSRRFAARGIEPELLWYEDLESDLHAAILRIAALIPSVGAEGVRCTPPFVQSRFQSLPDRQRNALNAEWRMRFLAGE